MSSRSFVEFISGTERSTCGYCKNQTGSKKEGTSNEDESGADNETNITSGSAWAHQLLTADYGEILDVGWRRSGRYLYKPENRVSCCPQYTIRLDVNKFQMSRSQKRVMRQMNEFLATGKRPVCGVKEEMDVEMKTEEVPEQKHPEIAAHKGERKEKDADRPVLKKKEIRNKKFEEKCRRLNLNPEAIRSERRAKEESRRRTIQSYIDEARPDWKHKLEVKMVSVKSDEFKQRFDESYELYKKYQKEVHKEDSRLQGFNRFLCDSPLKKERQDNIEMGSYHMWFLLDDKLIAVCVADVLPRCLSAKYMFYDTDYSFLSMGTYTALREIDHTLTLNSINNSLQYYYMGYYIHSCPKMRYKAKFRPSDLLCDKSFQWLDFKHCKPLLDASTQPNGFTEFHPECQRPAPIDIDDLLVFSEGAVMSLKRALEDIPSAADDGDLLENARKITDLLGPRIGNVVFWFKELNIAQ